MKFTKKYDTFISLLKDVIPKIQLEGLEKRPKINSMIIPPPQDWFINSFDWYVGLKLIRGAEYGPFYRIDGEYFWPTIGNLYDIYSESQCFFGIEKPVGYNDAESLYKLRPNTPKDYVYEIKIEMPKWPIIDDAYLFLGAVKDAEGFQVNPNRVVVEMIRKEIENNKLRRFASPDSVYDYKDLKQYKLIQTK